MSSTGQVPLVPPPQGAMFPPPNPSRSSSPSRSGSSNKRRRTESYASSVVSSSAVSSTSGFSANVKKSILRSGANCWHCGASPVHACHVVAKKDRSFERLKRQGLITFDYLGVVDNGIPLCATCHDNFDDINSPGFIFFPSDLQFFIDFEEQDFQRREREARMGRLVPARICPTAQAYKDHQVDMGAVDDDACGGLYQRYMLHDYLSTILPRDPNATLPLKSWHGAPMASLRRTFQIHGDPLSGAILVDQRELLRKLQDLYMRPAPSRSEDDVEERAPGVDIAHEEVETSVARDEDGPGSVNAQAGASAMLMTARHEGLGGRSTPTELAQEEPGTVAKCAGDSAIGISNSQSTSSAHTSPPQPSRKRRRSSSDNSHYTDNRLKHFSYTTSEQQWKWGPHSSSLNKATWFPAMMGWRGGEVGDG
ncbi:hypothetical protein H2199_009107 [Coniosporium tulheliwenetii]|uniref:Uncharacterized protein n=1 Tax=Coniosporium tulheliwenetii TaxID=3383036 RepID=A0ACC2YFT3_9PEZI|nr:hypothetical protein H2199_009107 [Cladosporium sp. JES 115]